MKMKEIRIIARKHNVQPGRMTKQNLVRAIQREENNSPCFQTELDFCDQYDCCWRSDCRPGDTQ